MSTSLYTVTDLAGPWVAGRRAQHGADLLLTPDEAEYELRVGTIVPSGSALPVVVPPAAVLLTDVIGVRRGALTHDITVADLVTFLQAAAASADGSLDFSNPQNSGLLPGIGG